jgi:hypothetical protein
MKQTLFRQSQSQENRQAKKDAKAKAIVAKSKLQTNG